MVEKLAALWQSIKDGFMMGVGIGVALVVMAILINGAVLAGLLAAA